MNKLCSNSKLFSMNVSFHCWNTCNYYLLVLFMINICMTWSINDGIGSFLNYHGDQSAGKYLHNHLLKARRVVSFHSWCHENILRHILELSRSDLWKICSNAVKRKNKSIFLKL